MYYGAKPMQKPGEDTSYPAIIDTGSSQLSIPPDVFEKLDKNGLWHYQILIALLTKHSVTLKTVATTLPQE